MDSVLTGDVISPLYDRVDIWDLTLFLSIEQVNKGNLLLVIGGPPKLSENEKKYVSQRAQIKVLRYLKVLTPSGKTGWVLRDNCRIHDQNLSAKLSSKDVP